MTRKYIAHRAWRLCTLAVISAVVIGCSAGNNPHDGDLTIQRRADPDDIAAGGFDRGIYSFDGPSVLTVLLTEGPAEKPRRALIVRMFWKPKAASTPLDETATNATVQYVVFGGVGDEDVGIYSGGGFLYPETDPGGAVLTANLWQATLSLADKSEGFEDVLGPSILRGRFNAQRDDEGMVDALRRVNIAVSEALGVPRFVRGD
jgi:hypothetical protein